jgi:hypothetical protein
MKTKLVGWSLGVIGCALLVAAPAMARVGTAVCGDNDHEPEGERRGKASNGLECQIDWQDKAKTTWGYNAGQLCHHDTKDEILVHCPLLREQTESTEGLTCAAATLVHQGGDATTGTTTPCHYFAPPQNGFGSPRFECILRSSKAHGWAGWWFGTGPGEASPSVNITPFGGPAKVWATEWRASMWHSTVVDGDHFHGGSYTLSCTLPSVADCGGEVCIAGLKWFEAEPE